MTNDKSVEPTQNVTMNHDAGCESAGELPGEKGPVAPGPDPQHEKTAESGTNETKLDLNSMLEPMVCGAFVIGYIDQIHGAGGELTKYQPTADECWLLAEHWICQMVVETTWDCGTSGSYEIRWWPYALSRLKQLLDLGIVTKGQLNHLLYVERKEWGLDYGYRETFGDGTIEHPQGWLVERENMRWRKGRGLTIPKRWEPFVYEEFGPDGRIFDEGDYEEFGNEDDEEHIEEYNGEDDVVR